MDLDKIVFLRNFLSVRWHTVVFPFRTDVFAQALDSAGYILDEKYLRLRGHRDPIEIEAGILGRKGSAAVVINPDRGYVGISSLDPISQVEAFEEVEGIIESVVGFASREHAWFYEYVCFALMPVSGAEDDTWIRKYQGSSVVADIGSIFGVDLAPAGIRLKSRNDLLGPDWTDIRISPISPDFDRNQELRITHRRRDRDSVITLASRIQEMVRSIAQYLDG